MDLITEAKTERQKLEDLFLNMLSDYAAKYNVTVRGIDLETIRAQTLIEKYPRTVVTGVIIRVEL